MNLSKKLEKLREASIKGPTPIYVHSYNKGFNAACELLLPEIEKMRAVLKDISVSNCCACRCDNDAIDALKQWQEFAEGE